MFSKLYSRLSTIERHETAPLAAARITYLKHLCEHGMCEGRLRDVAARIYKLATSVNLTETSIISVSDLEAFAEA